MTTIARPQPATAEEVLEAATGLLPAIGARAAEIEDARRLPPDLLADLVAAGCFRVLLPPSHGGIGASLPEAMRVVETLSRADASVGWTVMIGAGCWVDLAGLPRGTFDALYAGGEDVMIAGVFSPAGMAVPVDGGYRVTGRWGFASGSPHAEWLYGNCVEDADGDSGLRIALFARDEVEVEDTWHTLGLRGTGSHHFRVDNVVVPAERTWAIMEDEPSVDEPIVRVPPAPMFALAIGAFAAGVAQGAHDDITAAAATKVPLLAGAPLATSPTFQHQLAVADTELRAARAVLYEAATEAWDLAAAGANFSPDLRARMRAAAAWTVGRAARVVTAAYRSGGSGALYLDSPLQRRLRDIHTATQHFLVRPDVLTTAGALLAGQEIDVPIF